MTWRKLRAGWAIGLVLALWGGRTVAGEGAAPVHAVRVTILSSMIVDYIGDNEGVGEWGFAAFVEVDDRRFLFDTGAHPDTVLRNARALHIDLSGVTDVVLSHFHGDHTGGLVALRKELRRINPHALERAHVASGFFWPRRDAQGPDTGTQSLRREYERLGGRFVEHAAAAEIAPGVYLTGPVPRVTDERNYPAGEEVLPPDGQWRVDDVPDDDSLVLDTDRGLVVITGCGHAGIINTLRVARDVVRSAPVEAVIGGLHLFALSDARVDWTAGEMRRLDVRHLLAAHCTGLEALYRIRAGAGLDRATAVQAAVGSRYSLTGGIESGGLTR